MLINLTRKKNVFAILNKSIIFQLFPRVVRCIKSLTILQWNVSNNRCFTFDFSHERSSRTGKIRIGFSAATIGIGEESDKEKDINGECEIVFGSPASWLSKS